MTVTFRWSTSITTLLETINAEKCIVSLGIDIEGEKSENEFAAREVHMWILIYATRGRGSRDRLPVVVERYSKTDLPEMEKKKYLVPRDMSVGQFIHILSSRLHLAPGKALFVFVNDTLPQTSSLMESVYESSKDENGFLYMCYSSEQTFGFASVSTV